MDSAVDSLDYIKHIAVGNLKHPLRVHSPRLSLSFWKHPSALQNTAVSLEHAPYDNYMFAFCMWHAPYIVRMIAFCMCSVFLGMFVLLGSMQKQGYFIQIYHALLIQASLARSFYSFLACWSLSLLHLDMPSSCFNLICIHTVCLHI